MESIPTFSRFPVASIKKSKSCSFIKMSGSIEIIVLGKFLLVILSLQKLLTALALPRLAL